MNRLPGHSHALTRHKGCEFKAVSQIEPGEPLWKLAPTRDENGKPLCDFMVLIPKLGKRAPEHVSFVYGHISSVLDRYDEVVFANMDLALNLLWVSHKHRHGLAVEIVCAIRQNVPEAVLVAHNVPA